LHPHEQQARRCELVLRLRDLAAAGWPGQAPLGPPDFAAVAARLGEVRAVLDELASLKLLALWRLGVMACDPGAPAGDLLSVPVGDLPGFLAAEWATDQDALVRDLLWVTQAAAAVATARLCPADRKHLDLMDRLAAVTPSAGQPRTEAYGPDPEE